VDEPRTAEPEEVRLQKSETDDGVGYLLVWSGYLRGVHDFRCLIAIPGLKHEQVICGHAPFLDLPLWTVAGAIIEGKRPTRPAYGFTDSLWRIAERCWQHERKDRPSIGTVVEWLDEASRA
jgi:hypothetical protein